MLSTEIRELFKKFFLHKDHQYINSSSLLPLNDSSILFVNAGMVPFKNSFLGIEKPDSLNVCSIQKCLRAGGKHNDLNNVGYTNRHHTFFEMLGNFSFGGYFKEQAIKYAWDFITKELKIDTKRLYITYYHSDLETYNLWKKIANLDESRVVAVSSSDNFWQMSETGPCGPCTEIFYDHDNGIDVGFLQDNRSDLRYVEIWNIVFMENNITFDNKKEKILTPCIDTGMGLERITAVLQGTDDNYRTDLFSDIREKTQFLSKNINLDDVVLNIISDHLRSTVFLSFEHIEPSNTGRGYIMRKIIRRAVTYYYLKGIKEPFLWQIVDFFIKKMSFSYPDLKTKKKHIEEEIKKEEEFFISGLSKTMSVFNNITKEMNKGDFFPGEKAFFLYDTYGMPVEILKEMLFSRGMNLNEEKFLYEMQLQKQRGKESWKKNLSTGDLYGDISDIKSSFQGYESLTIKTTIKRTFNKEKNILDLFLEESPFYGESGGQKGDLGVIKSTDGQSVAEVIDTQKINNMCLVRCKIIKGSFYDDQCVLCEVDEKTRFSLSSLHSATHLLHKALKIKFGDSIRQKGSLVSYKKLRFDFNYNKSITNDELCELEDIVNSFIHDNTAVQTEIKNTEEAIKTGAESLFGEKYLDKSRVVSIGPSIELCGGTHVSNTSEIGLFKIINEKSIASGIRRIEAIVGSEVLKFYRNKEKEYKTNINNLKEENRNISVSFDKVKNDYYSLFLDSSPKKLFLSAKENDFFIQEVDFIPHKEIRKVVLGFSQKRQEGVFAFLSKDKNKKILLISCTQKSVDFVSADFLIKAIANAFNIKGGGNKYLAQTSNMERNIDDVIDVIKKAL